MSDIVNPMLTTTSEQRPPVSNGQSDPQTSQINTSFIRGTSEQRLPLNKSRFFGVPRVAVVYRFDCMLNFIQHKIQPETPCSNSSSKSETILMSDMLFFIWHNSLRQHVQTVHENLKPLQCKIYFAAFGTKDHLKRHSTIVHEKLKPFQRKICSTFLGIKGNLHCHIKTVYKNT